MGVLEKAALLSQYALAMSRALEKLALVFVARLRDGHTVAVLLALQEFALVRFLAVLFAELALAVKDSVGEIAFVNIDTVYRSHTVAFHLISYKGAHIFIAIWRILMALAFLIAVEIVALIVAAIVHDELAFAVEFATDELSDYVVLVREYLARRALSESVREVAFQH